MHSKFGPFSLHFMGEELFPVNTIKDFRSIFLDSNLPFDKDVTKRASSCIHHLSQDNKHTISNSNKLFYCSMHGRVPSSATQ